MRPFSWCAGQTGHSDAKGHVAVGWEKILRREARSDGRAPAAVAPRMLKGRLSRGRGADLLGRALESHLKWQRERFGNGSRLHSRLESPKTGRARIRHDSHRRIHSDVHHCCVRLGSQLVGCGGQVVPLGEECHRSLARPLAVNIVDDLDTWFIGSREDAWGNRVGGITMGRQLRACRSVRDGDVKLARGTSGETTGTGSPIPHPVADSVG